MAEGLVDHDIGSESSLEEATQSYLDALISSSLIMVDHIKKTGSKHLISLKVSGSLNLFWYICHTRHMRLVRVLQLDDIVLKDSLIEEIGSLFHLRFLRIYTQDVKAIPVSWLNLQNLETLLLNTEYTMVLLPRILKLSKLKHVKIHRSCFFEKEEEEDNIQSRILEGENSKLTTLSHVDIAYSEGTNDALKKFPNLQHLECSIRTPEDPPTHGDWFPKFDVLNKLESLFVEYRWFDCVYPNEYHFPISLKELRLLVFPLTPALLSAITALPQLEILAIILSYFVEDKWDASDDIYQSLKTLTLRRVDLSEWEVDRETFPKLEELILHNCYKLTEIPCAFAGIETLKSIQLMHMKREVEDSAIEIKKQIIDFAGEDRLQVYLSVVLYELEAEEENQTENAQRTEQQ
ncbi:hypothetical protein H5410_019729 [Solanum commersonii]|uniref:Disease resistance R13L4/SHOC-2-like LRR domain-containing protein n=1 Tax=Solanum commersonii TaxID=4109 RepID=A0A9J5Z955_SOLCO|nr:hypothetical protein H5410_019729 [Solanum commersonii]